MAAISVQGLTYAYQDAPVLRNVDLEVPEARFSVILGPNGSGKSTLLKLIAGLLRPQSGTIRLLGKDVRDLSRGERARLVGYLSQFHLPVFPFTVEEVVLTGRASYVFSLPSAKDRERARCAIAEVGIEELAQRPYTELSGGERQLVMIARLLAQEPRIVLLDEPISHLDLANQTRFMQLAQKLVKSGLTVVAVLHDPNISFLYGEDFFFLKGGAVMKPPARQRPWDSHLLSEVYGLNVQAIEAEEGVFVIPRRERGPAGDSLHFSALPGDQGRGKADDPCAGPPRDQDCSPF